MVICSGCGIWMYVLNSILYILNIAVVRVVLVGARCIPHRTRRQRKPSIKTTLFSTFRRSLEALRIEWQNSTPRFYYLKIIIRHIQRYLNGCVQAGKYRTLLTYLLASKKEVLNKYKDLIIFLSFNFN